MPLRGTKPALKRFLAVAMQPMGGARLHGRANPTTLPWPSFDAWELLPHVQHHHNPRVTTSE